VTQLPSDDTLALVAPNLDVLEDFQAALIESYADHKEFLPWALPNPSIEETRRIMEEAARNFANVETELRFIIIKKPKNRVVGCVGLHIRDPSIGLFEIGYWTRTSQNGRGYCTRAVALVERYAITELNAKRLEIKTAMSNTASARVAVKAGYTLESTTPGDRPLPSGKIDGTYVFSKQLF
jgi:ribosomal-protein-serine acetyltransferase